MDKTLAKTFDINKFQKMYLEYIDVSQKTIDTYNIALRQFGYYIKQNNILRPTREDVIKFREKLKETHKVATINSYLIALRNFFRFLEYNEIYKNITENVKGLKDAEIHKRNSLTIEQCQKVIEKTNSLREKMIVLLALSCGLRINEIVNIQINDFKEENGNYVLYVLGKGRDYKQDYVIIPKQLIESLKEYVKEYNITNYLFVSTSNNNKGGKMHPSAVRKMINNIYERANIKTDKIVAHSLRHTFGTLAIENGEDIREVSKAMRHKSIVVTERYLHDIEMKNNKCSNLVFDILESR